jgi:hypothetical protein
MRRAHGRLFSMRNAWKALCRNGISRMRTRACTTSALGDVQDSPVPQGFRGGQAGRSPGAFVPKRIPIGAGGEAANYHPAGRLRLTLWLTSRVSAADIAQRSPLVRFSRSSGPRVPPDRFSASRAPAAPRGLNPQGNPSSEREVRGQLTISLARAKWSPP